MTSNLTVGGKGMPINELMKFMQHVAPGQNATIQAQFNPQVMLEQMFVRYKSRLLELSSKKRKLDEFDARYYENNDNFLQLPSKPEATEVQLGDRVKICMKKRQFKQLRVGSWNESITQDFDSVGTVISLWEDGEREAVVHYYRSGKNWVISRRCLIRCNDNTDEVPPKTNGILKVGDAVKIPYENSVVQDMQTGRGGSSDQIILLRPFLHKILAFDNRENAFVSYDSHQSVLINSALLTPRPQLQPSATFVTKEMKDAATRFPVESQVVLREVEILFQHQNWNYNLTELIGSNDLRVRFHCHNGLIGVSKSTGSNTNIYLLDKNLIKRKRKHPKRRVKGIRQKITNSLALQKVQEVYVARYGFEQLLLEMRIPADFLWVLMRPGKMLGYQAPNVVVVEINKQTIMLPTSMVVEAKEGDLCQELHQQAEGTSILKVGDHAILDIGPFSLAAQQFQATFDQEPFPTEMMSKAVILAFDDHTDEAILRFRNGSIYAVPTEFVVAPNRFSENIIKVPVPRSTGPQFAPLRYSSEEMDLVNSTRCHFERMTPTCLAADQLAITAIRKDDTLEVARGNTKVTVVQTLEEVSLLGAHSASEQPSDVINTKLSQLPPLPAVDNPADDNGDDETSSQATTNDVDSYHHDVTSVSEEDFQPSDIQSSPERINDKPVARRTAASSALSAVRYERDRNEIVISCNAFSEQPTRSYPRPAVSRQNSMYGKVPESQKEVFNGNNYSFNSCTFNYPNIAVSAPVKQTIVQPVAHDA